MLYTSYQDFIRQEAGLTLEEYYQEIEYQNDHNPILRDLPNFEYLRDFKYPIDIVDRSFTWSNTKQGKPFWAEVHRKWQDFWAYLGEHQKANFKVQTQVIDPEFRQYISGPKEFNEGLL